MTATASLPTQPLGRSPVRVTELSFGGATIGNLFTAVTEEAARAAVDAAWDGGIRTFDTAPHYGLGLSERRLGEALRARPRDEYVICTKVGRLLEPAGAAGAAGDQGSDTEGFAVPASLVRRFDFSADGVRRSLEASLARLGLDRVDIVLIHDPDDHGDQAIGEAYPALEKLRADGVVGAIGAGMNQAAMLTRFVTETDIDVVLVAGRYTLLDQSAADALLPAAEARGVSVIAGGVFNSGLLAAPAPGATYDYQAASGELLDRALRLEQACARFGVPLRAVAARFPLNHPAVASVLIGARSAAEISEAVRLRDLDIPRALWDAVAAVGVTTAKGLA
ncbi:aldo/keto reductase [Trebonia kvetii]|uniref:aldo/keto reductase n=1 Tax=Trebonia kvetii TaxID=2480626 RepID=UPI001FEAE08C|nr:aldo/keto reductase [Trebonia kvetii]